jgi:hypothetical protein
MPAHRSLTASDSVPDDRNDLDARSAKDGFIMADT